MKKLGFGCMRLPVLDGDAGKVDLERFKGMVDSFMARGFTYYDTAYVYHKGKSEDILRQALVERYPRDSFTVTTKLPMFDITKKEQMQPIFDEQLRRLGVDYIDYYWLHALNAREYKKVQQFDAFGFLSRLKAEGKIRHIGFSFHDSPAVLERILIDHPEVEFVQLQINYTDWESPSICSRECYELSVKYNKPVIVMEPLKGGALASVPKAAEELFRAHAPNMSPASWGIRFCASLENVIMVLSGMSTEEQLADNLNYMEHFVPLTEEEMQIVWKAEEIIREQTTIPCTACRYCVEGCPKHIAIPDCFGLYNDHVRMRGKSTNPYYYENLIKEHGRAKDCIGCGKCENICPQHLPIRKYLKTVSETFD